MQVGLKVMADAVTLLFSEVPSKCVSSQGAQTILKGAKKLAKLTRRTVVDYGTLIKYEALSSLVVGGLNVHQEVNNFITAWRLHTHKSSGESFAKLMQKFSKMSGMMSFNDIFPVDDSVHVDHAVVTERHVSLPPAPSSDKFS